MTTKGLTSAKNKYYPKFLRPWEKFPDVQLDLFNNIRRLFQTKDEPDRRLFNSTQFTQELAGTLALRKLSSEKDLETYERIAVEDMVTAVLNALSTIPKARAELGLGEKIKFENHTNSLSDQAEEVQERIIEVTEGVRRGLRFRTPSPPSLTSSSETEATSEAKPRLPRTRADQFCVYGEENAVNRLLFLVEYKAPHKLSVGNLKAGVRDMDIKEEVLDRVKIPVYKEKPEADMTPEDEIARQEKLQYNADRLIAAVLAQTFHTMIDFGLKYGYLTTGEAFVFLRVREDDPQTLYYHLAVPGEIDTIQTSLAQTAISQVMSLCVMAFQSTQRTHSWRRKAKAKLSKAQINWENVLRQIPESERKKSPKSAGYHGRKGSKRSPYLFRQSVRNKNRNRSSSSSNDEEGPSTSSITQGASGHSQGKINDASNRTAKSTNRENNRGRGKNNEQVKEATGPRSYCTQACLLGLARGGTTDPRCPNLKSHQTIDDHHAIDGGDLSRLIKEQLAADPERGCRPLGLQGARGALFKIDLLSHSYVLVAKGTVKAFVPDMSHEAKVYRHLESLQGVAIPICFGHVRLRHRYYLDLGVKISHMLLLSWGGKTIGGEVTESHREARKTVQEVLKAGIDQADVRRANLLWNEEVGRVMLIDFERANFLSSPEASTPRSAKRSALQALSPNKRSRHVETEKGSSMLEALPEWTMNDNAAVS